MPTAPTISPREREVLPAVADRLTNAEIADRLHVSALLRKLDARDRRELATRAPGAAGLVVGHRGRARRGGAAGGREPGDDRARPGRHGQDAAGGGGAQPAGRALNGSTWQATVIVAPRRWPGLEFAARDPATGRRTTYDISQASQREFAGEIERDIIEFLENLSPGTVLRGNDGAKSVVVPPLDGAYVRVVQGRFTTKASTHPDLAAANVGGGYVPLD
ncbi:helix-turn-helix transcriptional regulator [Streptomyces sp. MN03-5084-2B]|nr:helix-turn-helix transcriptional regulator [Streptomyces sp. MN03-5084-2B]